MRHSLCQVLLAAGVSCAMVGQGVWAGVCVHGTQGQASSRAVNAAGQPMPHPPQGTVPAQQQVLGDAHGLWTVWTGAHPLLGALEDVCTCPRMELAGDRCAPAGSSADGQTRLRFCLHACALHACLHVDLGAVHKGVHAWQEDERLQLARMGSHAEGGCTRPAQPVHDSQARTSIPAGCGGRQQARGLTWRVAPLRPPARPAAPLTSGWLAQSATAGILCHKFIPRLVIILSLEAKLPLGVESRFDFPAAPVPALARGELR